MQLRIQAHFWLEICTSQTEMINLGIFQLSFTLCKCSTLSKKQEMNLLWKKKNKTKQKQAGGAEQDHNSTSP